MLQQRSVAWPFYDTSVSGTLLPLMLEGSEFSPPSPGTIQTLSLPSAVLAVSDGVLNLPAIIKLD